MEARLADQMTAWNNKHKQRNWPRGHKARYQGADCLATQKWRRWSKYHKTNKILLGGWGFRKNHTLGFKWCFVYTLVSRSLKCELLFLSGGGFEWNYNFVRFAGLLRTFAMAPYSSAKQNKDNRDRKAWFQLFVASMIKFNSPPPL